MKKADVIIDEISKQFIKSERKGKVFQYKDTRTKIIDGVPHICPVGVDQIHVYIICPYCGSFHQHGSSGGEKYEGGRVSHCMGPGNVKNYYIEK